MYLHPYIKHKIQLMQESWKAEAPLDCYECGFWNGTPESFVYFVECFSRTRSLVFIRVNFQAQFLISPLNLLSRAIFLHPKNFVIALGCFYLPNQLNVFHSVITFTIQTIFTAQILNTSFLFLSKIVPTQPFKKRKKNLNFLNSLPSAQFQMQFQLDWIHTQDREDLN